MLYHEEKGANIIQYVFHPCDLHNICLSHDKQVIILWKFLYEICYNKNTISNATKFSIQP